MGFERKDSLPATSAQCGAAQINPLRRIGFPTGTHLSLTLKRQNPTVAVPFTVITAVAYPKELRTLGNHLRKKRLDLGVLQRDVARTLNVSNCSVWYWENNRTPVQTYLIPRVVDFLGYAPWEAPVHFGRWLRMVWHHLGLSRKRLGRYQHIDESTLWHLESGQRAPTRQTEERLRALLLSIASGTPHHVRRRGRTLLLPGRQ